MPFPCLSSFYDFHFFSQAELALKLENARYELQRVLGGEALTKKELKRLEKVVANAVRST